MGLLALQLLFKVHQPSTSMLNLFTHDRGGRGGDWVLRYPPRVPQHNNTDFPPWNHKHPVLFIDFEETQSLVISVLQAWRLSTPSTH